MMENFNKIVEELKLLKRKKSKSDKPFAVPGLWMERDTKPIEMRAEDFFLDRFERIETLIESEAHLSYKNTEDARIYNVFARLTTAYNHDRDGDISADEKPMPWRQTGTFLKTIALLPYLKSLGINTIYFLPITSIGIDEKKGTLGSPYAIRNPYKLDENLAEPALEASIETQFTAFVEAAHALGMKVIVEFVFRTASVDSDLALEHPEWFYWIKAKIKNRSDKKNSKQYGPPIFKSDVLEKIISKVEHNKFDKLPQPPKEHREMFVAPPKKVARVENKIIGMNESPRGRNSVESFRIPGAFADWPPNDSQPVWSDVTYLRMYDHEDFNYIAYNTIRMYDTKLARPENIVDDLWQSIISIIPHYQNEYSIDGVMIDMGHALPSKLRAELVETARRNNPNFTFWEENFVISQSSADEGYDAVLGYLPFDATAPMKLHELIAWLGRGECPVPFFATPETHNTKRSASREGGIAFSKASYIINSFLPTMTLILTGFELGEQMPINTGLGFEESDYEKYPAWKLPLFSESMLSWENENNIVEFIKKANEFRDKYFKRGNSIKSRSMLALPTNYGNALAFTRRSDLMQKEILIAINMSANMTMNLEVDMLDGYSSVIDAFSGKTYPISDGTLISHLEPLEFICGELV